MTATRCTQWRELTPLDHNRLSSLAINARATSPVFSYLDDCEYTATSHGWPDQEVLLLCNDGDGVVNGAVVLGRARVPLVYSMGPMILMRLKVIRYLLKPTGVLADPRPDFDLDGFFRCLAGTMGDTDVVFADFVPTDSALGRALRDPTSGARRHFHALPWGAELPSFSIDWAGSVEQYLMGIRQRSRQDFRRRRRNFLADATIRSDVRTFRESSEIDGFVRDGMLVSEKTWQMATRVGGLDRGGPVERKIRAAAARGEFLGHILYIDEVPVAFQYGFVVARTCSLEQMGYDPAWKERHHVGSILFLEAMYDLERRKVPINTIDLLHGATLFKERVSSRRFDGRNYYLFKRSLRGTTLYYSMMITDALSRAVGELLRKVRIRAEAPRAVPKPAIAPE